MARNIEQHLVQPSELLAHHPPHRQQRLDDRRQSRIVLDQLADPRVITAGAHRADLEAKVAQRAA